MRSSEPRGKNGDQVFPMQISWNQQALWEWSAVALATVHTVAGIGRQFNSHSVWFTLNQLLNSTKLIFIHSINNDTLFCFAAAQWYIILSSYSLLYKSPPVTSTVSDYYLLCDPSNKVMHHTEGLLLNLYLKYRLNCPLANKTPSTDGPSPWVTNKWLVPDSIPESSTLNNQLFLHFFFLFFTSNP